MPRRPSSRSAPTSTGSSARTATAHVIDGLPFAVFATESTAPGPGTAEPPFVLVHGIGTSHRYLARLHGLLARTADVYSIDLPGFGGVAKPDGVPDVTAVASGLATLLESLGVAGAIAIGHSMGAQWVTELAVLRPDLVSRVVLIGPVTDDRHRTLRAQAVALALDTLGETPVVNAMVFTDYLRAGPVWFLQHAQFMRDYPLEHRVRELAGPMLVLRGGDDPVAGPDWCRRLRREAPAGSRVVVVPGHRHVVQHTAAPAVASAIRAFLADPDPWRT
ncbi:alpha/beta fold hydrolase [Herbiconiux sp. P18]|uniref:alpha/beta fold hydrolase n=1 Tax=Herbiconiux liangxiaofengii TaxID=3342795 RepID=UPI0035B947C8